METQALERDIFKYEIQEDPNYIIYGTWAIKGFSLKDLSSRSSDFVINSSAFKSQIDSFSFRILDTFKREQAPLTMIVELKKCSSNYPMRMLVRLVNFKNDNNSKSRETSVIFNENAKLSFLDFNVKLCDVAKEKNGYLQNGTLNIQFEFEHSEKGFPIKPISLKDLIARKEPTRRPRVVQDAHNEGNKVATIKTKNSFDYFLYMLYFIPAFRNYVYSLDLATKQSPQNFLYSHYRQLTEESFSDFSEAAAVFNVALSHTQIFENYAEILKSRLTPFQRLSNRFEELLQIKYLIKTHHADGSFSSIEKTSYGIELPKANMEQTQYFDITKLIENFFGKRRYNKDVITSEIISLPDILVLGIESYKYDDYGNIVTLVTDNFKVNSSIREQLLLNEVYKLVAAYSSKGNFKNQQQTVYIVKNFMNNEKEWYAIKDQTVSIVSFDNMDMAAMGCLIYVKASKIVELFNVEEKVEWNLYDDNSILVKLYNDNTLRDDTRTYKDPFTNYVTLRYKKGAMIRNIFNDLKKNAEYQSDFEIVEVKDKRPGGVYRSSTDLDTPLELTNKEFLVRELNNREYGKNSVFGIIKFFKNYNGMYAPIQYITTDIFDHSNFREVTKKLLIEPDQARVFLMNEDYTTTRITDFNKLPEHDTPYLSLFIQSDYANPKIEPLADIKVNMERLNCHKYNVQVNSESLYFEYQGNIYDDVEQYLSYFYHNALIKLVDPDATWYFKIPLSLKASLIIDFLKDSLGYSANFYITLQDEKIVYQTKRYVGDATLSKEIIEYEKKYPGECIRIYINEN